MDNFFEMLKGQYGEKLAEDIIKSRCIKRKTTFRVNTLKSDNEKIEKVLKENKIIFQKVSWYDNAYILENANEIDLQLLDIYKNGEIYLQSLSSMLPPLVLKPEEDKDILDMAAAPRWKGDSDCSLD